MDKLPAISIIVPVYHVEKELKRCLDSLLAQTFTDYEIILVNDGGNETESEICEEYAAKNPRIMYRCQTNQGISGARNTGLSMSRGSWIMFADSDDWVKENFCQTAFDAVNNNQAQIAIFDLEYYTNDEKRTGRIYRSSLKEGVYPMETVLQERLAGKIAGYLCNKIYKRELWNGIVFPVGEIWEDDAVLHEVVDRADKIVILHDVLYCCRTGRTGSITNLAYRTGEWSKWVYIQRRKRYLYLNEHHPELLYIECNIMARAALQYACFLTKSKDGLSEIRDVSKWLRVQNVCKSKGSVKAKTAYYLLFHFPTIFYYLFKMVVGFRIIKV